MLTVTQVFARPFEQPTGAALRDQLAARFDAARRARRLAPLEGSARLDAVAAEHAPRIPAGGDPGAVVEQAARRAIAMLARDPAVAGVDATVQVTNDPAAFQPPALLLEPRAVRVGFAVAEARAADGTPRWKLLVLVALGR